MAITVQFTFRVLELLPCAFTSSQWLLSCYEFWKYVALNVSQTPEFFFFFAVLLCLDRVWAGKSATLDDFKAIQDN